MVAACVCTVALFGSVGVRMVPGAALRRVLMGVAMGVTAVMIIHSPMGKRSGAHFNPAITLTYLRLGKIGVWDAVGYVVGQFVGGVAGVGVSALMLGRRLAQPSVEYAVTVPGIYGTAGAFAAELFMAVLLMGGGAVDDESQAACRRGVCAEVWDRERALREAACCAQRVVPV